MTVTIANATTSLLLYDSADGSGTALSGLTGPIKRMLDGPVAYLRGSEALPLWRGNKSSVLSWEISRPCASEEEAARFFFTHEEAIPHGDPGAVDPTARQARLILVFGDSTVTIAGEIQTVSLAKYMPGRVFHAYSFLGGIPRVSEPLTDESGDALTDESGTPLAS